MSTISTAANIVHIRLNLGETLNVVATFTNPDGSPVSLVGWTSTFKGEYATVDPSGALAIDKSIGSGIVVATNTLTLTVQTSALTAGRMNYTWRTTDSAAGVRDISTGVLTLVEVAS